MRLIRTLCRGFALSFGITPLAAARGVFLSFTMATTIAMAAVAPTITTQPANKTVTLGAKATFTVVASGTAALKYRWSKRGTAISGATSASYTTPTTVAGDNGATFTVKVSNSAGNVTSSAAKLTLNLPPNITAQPSNKTVTLGSTATFIVVASGTATLKYQWSKRGTAISGATSASYTTPATVAGDNGATFTVKVTNTYGNKASAAATLTLTLPPTITTQPSNKSVTLGSTATFTVVASGTGTLSYQWSKNGTAITGATAASYTTPATVTGDNGSTYTVKVANTYGNVSSVSATLTIQSAVVVTLTPASATVACNSTVALISKVTGTSNTGVAWSVSGGSANGWVTSSGIYYAPARPGTYSVIATSVEDSSKSAIAAVTVQNSVGLQVTVSPSEVILAPSETYTFTAWCQGAMTPVTYTYSCSSGTIQNNGDGAFTYTAPTTPGNYALTAKLQGKQAQACALVHVQNPPAGVSVVVNPQGAVITPSEIVFLSAIVSGDGNPEVTWSVVGGDSNGRVDTSYSCFYIPPSLPGTYTVMATLAADTSKTAQVDIQVIPQVNVQGSDSEVFQGGVASFSASVIGLSDQGVTWSTTAGSIASDGSFTAPMTPTMVMITATSSGDPRAKGMWYINVPAIRVRLTSYASGSWTTDAGNAMGIEAIVDGVADTSVTWSLTSGVGSIVADPGSGSNSVLYLAPYSPGTAVIQATSVADGNKKASAKITIQENPDPVIRSFSAMPSTIAPGSSTMLQGDFGPGSGVVSPIGNTLIAGQALSVAPAASTQYTLTVTKPGGTPAMATATVGVVDRGTFSEAIPFPEGSSPIDMKRAHDGRIVLLAKKISDGKLYFYRFDPEALTYSELSGTAAVPPIQSTNVLLQDDRIWIVGGHDESRFYETDSWIYDPMTGARVAGPELLSNHRMGALLQLDGRVLLTGGKGFPPGITWCQYDCLESKTWFGIYDPLSADWEGPPIGLNTPRSNHQSVPLADGRILIAGGVTNYTSPSLEIFDPSVGTCQIVSPEIKGPLAVTLRRDGRVECFGTEGQHWLWNPTSGGTPRSTTVGLHIASSDWDHTDRPLLLPDGRMLLNQGDGNYSLFSPELDQYYSIAENTSHGTQISAPLLLNNGRVLFIEGMGIRIFDPQAAVSITPAVLTAKGGSVTAFQATGDALAQGVTWSCEGGSITADGQWSAPLTAGYYWVTATSVQSPSKSSTARIQIFDARISVTAPKTALSPGESIQLSAVITNRVQQEVVWTIPAGSRAGTITSGGYYTAGNEGGVYTIEAASLQNPSVKGQIQITVQTSGLPMGLQISADRAVAHYGSELLLTFDGRNSNDYKLELVKNSSDPYFHCPLGSLQTPGTKIFKVQRIFKESSNPFGYNVAAPWVDTPTGGYFSEAQFRFTITGSNPAGTVYASTPALTFVDERAFEIHPKALTINPNGTLDLFVTPRIDGKSVPAVTWTASVGTITDQGHFTAPSQAGNVTITAAHSQEPGLTATTTISVSTSQPTAYLRLHPGERIPPGVPLKLQWDVNYASSISIGASTGESWDLSNAGICSGPRTYGELEVTPSVNTIYTLTVMNPNGTATSQKTVTLDPVQLTVNQLNATAYVGMPLALSIFGATSNYQFAYEVVEPGGGSVYGGNYQAPAQTGTYHIAIFPTIARVNQVVVSVTVLPYPYVEITPRAITLYASQSHQFGFTLVAPTNRKVWSATGGTITQDGLYTAPSGSGTFTVNVYSVDDPSKSASAVVTVISPVVTLSINPATVSLNTRDSMRFGCSISASNNDNRVAWSVQEAPSGGVIDASGIYTAPTSTGIYHVVVTSVADPNAKSTATVTVQYPDVQIQIKPTSVALKQGQAYHFGYSASEGFVNWTASGGLITSEGDYTAPETVGVYLVTAASVLNPAKSASATVTVELAAEPSILLSPRKVALFPGAGQAFSARVLGFTNTVVNWIVVESGGGSITAEGVYKAPATNGTYTIKATSVQDANVVATAAVTVGNVLISPQNLVLVPGMRNSFTASLAPGLNGPVTWSVDEGVGGSIDQEGIYTAPAVNGVFHVRASVPSGSASVVPVKIGLVDALLVGVQVDVQEVGLYLVSAKLMDALGNTLEGQGAFHLPVGLASPEVRFEAKAIRHTLQADGPWKIVEVQVDTVDGHSIQPADALSSLGWTDPLPLNGLQQPWSKLSGDFQSAGLSDSNGVLIGLQATFGIDLLAAGTYEVSAGLVDARGQRVASSGIQRLVLPAGHSSLSVSFSGSEIHQSGKDGPYTVVNLVLTGWQDECSPVVGTIPGFTASQFQ